MVRNKITNHGIYAFGFWLRCPWEVSHRRLSHTARLHQQPLLVEQSHLRTLSLVRHSSPSWPVSRALRFAKLATDGNFFISHVAERVARHDCNYERQNLTQYLEGNPKVRNMHLVRLHIWPRWKKPQLWFLDSLVFTLIPRFIRGTELFGAPLRHLGCRHQAGVLQQGTHQLLGPGRYDGKRSEKLKALWTLWTYYVYNTKIFTYKIDMYNLNIPYL